MRLHATTFDYLRPSATQQLTLNDACEAVRAYAQVLEAILPEGADKIFIMRELRTIAMWVNTCILRNADGLAR